VIFFDAGAIVGRLVQRDQHHAAASAYWNELANSSAICLTSNLVMAEAFTLIARRTTYQFAAAQARELYKSRILRIVRPTHSDEIAAISLFEKFADQQVSFVDCVSFAIMRHLGIAEVFGFDRHFAFAGFRLHP
jgi:predicted nucleic acid-binding protein